MYKKLYENEERKRRGKRGHKDNKQYSLPRRHEKTQQMYNKLFKEDIKKKNYVEIDYTMDGSVKQLFLNLTKMQIPFNYEKTLAEFFPEDMEVDGNGNYYKQIGDNGIMFCGHLDTYCREHKRVWHIIEGDIITSDGTTTLGGDDKAGITVMIKMMEAGVPGLYYFFRGEEGVTSPTGTWGSKQALKSRKDFFSNIKKCIAFDRKGTTSIISEQMYSQCCSDEFVKALVKEFADAGMEYKNDPTGMWCDSGVFMETIPECTNISVGFKSEHTFNEEQNIAHLEKLVEAAIKIDWESLPVKRDPTKVTKSIGRYGYDWDMGWDRYGTTDYYGRGGKYSKTDKLMGKNSYYPTTSSTSAAYKQREETRRDYVSMDDVFYHVVDILEQLDYECLNPDDFVEAAEMYFSNHDNNDFIGIKIIDYEIYMSDDATMKKFTNYGNLANFSESVVAGFEDDNSNNLDKELDKKINSDSNKSVTRSSDYYLYTKQQMDAFEEIAENNVDLVKAIMDDISTPNKTVTTNKLWLRVEEAFDKLKIKPDYARNGNGINPNTFMDWVSDHWLEMEDLIELSLKKEKIQTTSVSTMISSAKSGFLPELKNSNIQGTKYHNDEYVMYSKIVEKEPELIKLILKDFEINNKAEVRKSTKEKIWDELTRLDYKRTDRTVLTAYPDKFINWVYEYSDEISRYIGLKK